MLLSVIIPVHNGANFIRTAYEDILNQELEDVEIFFVDNNSTDDSAQIMQVLSAEDPRVNVLSERIKGAAATRNRGLAEARGKYVYFLDVDDRIFPGALKAMIDVLETHPEYDAVFGKMFKSYKKLEEVFPMELGSGELLVKEKPYWGLQWLSDLSTTIGPPAFLYRRSVFEKIGPYEVELFGNEDTALDIKLGMLCDIVHLDRYVYLYLKHNQSTTDVMKKQQNRVFMMWPRLTKSHLPFYLEHEVPLRFKEILFRGILTGFGKMLYLTKKHSERKALYIQLKEDIKPMKIPGISSLLLRLLVLFQSRFLFKVYIYYCVRTLPAVIEHNDRLLKGGRLKG